MEPIAKIKLAKTSPDVLQVGGVAEASSRFSSKPISVQRNKYKSKDF